MTEAAPAPGVVACCATREMQHATTPPNHATARATHTQQPSLKALAQRALERNNPRNADATTPENRATNGIALTPGLLRDRLLTLAVEEGIAAAIVRELPAADLEVCAGLPDDTLRAYARALRDSDLRERGVVPPDETATIVCRRCGPVYAAPEVARVLPVVRGLPTAAGCPWCHVQNRGAIPRPPVNH